MLSEGDTYPGADPIKAFFDTLPHTSIMTDVVVVFVGGSGSSRGFDSGGSDADSGGGGT